MTCEMIALVIIVDPESLFIAVFSAVKFNLLQSANTVQYHKPLNASKALISKMNTHILK